MVDYYLKHGHDVVLDATNLKRERRARFLSLARRHGRSTRAVVVATTPREAVRRNRQRDKAVPEAVIHRLARAYEEPAPEEGFDEIVYVRTGEEV